MNPDHNKFINELNLVSQESPRKRCVDKFFTNLWLPNLMRWLFGSHTFLNCGGICFPAVCHRSPSMILNLGEREKRKIEGEREKRERERERERKKERGYFIFCVQEKNNLIGGVSFATHERWACFLGVTRCGRSTSLDHRRHWQVGSQLLIPLSLSLTCGVGLIWVLRGVPPSEVRKCGRWTSNSYWHVGSQIVPPSIWLTCGVVRKMSSRSFSI